MIHYRPLTDASQAAREDHLGDLRRYGELCLDQAFAIGRAVLGLPLDAGFASWMSGYGEAIRTVARRRRHREAQALAHRGPDGCSRRVR